ncbi:S-adenosylmethionine decarboxylase family protein [Simkania sp.]|uniref:S-adenosylmethionine decarboxylase family protein n=1 Tax=Simkania sp. TaxID=34094 RepID=UPI003B520469
MKKLLFIFLFATFALHASEEPEQKFKGRHSLASYHECDVTALYDTESLRSAFLSAIEASGAHTLSFTEHLFDEGAYTLVVLLEESHATLHSHPECKACFVDLFTAGDTCDPKPFHHALIEYLRPALSNLNSIERG